MGITSASAASHVSKDTRRDALARAQVWTETNVASMDLRAGPALPGAFAPDELVTCTYVKHEKRGNTPKFHCRVAGGGGVVKVKYGAKNGEVYAEVLATRLMWALGFGADRQYPVRVLCHGCAEDPWQQQEAPVRGSHLFEFAMIERPLAGRLIESRDDSGWSWPELDLVDPTRGGASRAQVDALELLAVFLQHTDSKAPQQRLVCLDPRDDEEDREAPCARPFMYVHDVGLTFGGANSFNRNSVGSVNLERWAREPVWKDPAQCVGNLPKSNTGTLDNPRISEAGRAFLAQLLTRITDAQLRDLFTVARLERRSRGGTVDEWIAAFKQKRDEIAANRCPQ